ncbi:MAG: hypothetical protein NTZ33_14460 [Bacteroidetes bacterium]|nr:hypothetical protein [Bacteroidota bacterium]
MKNCRAGSYIVAGFFFWLRFRFGVSTPLNDRSSATSKFLSFIMVVSGCNIAAC